MEFEVLGSGYLHTSVERNLEEAFERMGCNQTGLRFGGRLRFVLM